MGLSASRSHFSAFLIDCLKLNPKLITYLFSAVMMLATEHHMLGEKKGVRELHHLQND